MSIFRRKNKQGGLRNSKMSDIKQEEEEKKKVVLTGKDNRVKAQSSCQNRRQHIANIDKIKNILTPSLAHHLVIFELESEIYVYVTTKKSLELFKSLKTSRRDDISRKWMDSTLISESSLNTFKNDLLKNIRNDEEVKKLGIQLGDKLIPKNIQDKLKEELQNDDNKIKNVLVFCEEKDIDYLWEWIYWDEKKFFWGKKFHICRIPNDRILKDGLKPQNIEIKQSVIIPATACLCGNEDKKCFNTKGDDLQGALNILRNLDSVDCIHFVAKIDISQENNDIYESCEEALGALGYDQNHNFKLLFLNIRIPNDVNNYEEMLRDPDYKLRVLNLKDLFTRSAEIWIDTNLDLTDDLALNFANDFYIELKKGRKTVPEVLTEARKKGDELCRLAYVVKGNPSTTVSWKAS